MCENGISILLNTMQPMQTLRLQNENVARQGKPHLLQKRPGEDAVALEAQRGGIVPRVARMIPYAFT